MTRLLVILIASTFLCGCTQETPKQTHRTITNSQTNDGMSVVYAGSDVDSDKGVLEVEAMSKDICYSDEEYINTDDIPEDLRIPIKDELPVVQTAILSVIHKYCENYGVNYEILSWEYPISIQFNNHRIFLLHSMSGTIRIHLAQTNRVVACIE